METNNRINYSIMAVQESEITMTKGECAEAFDIMKIIETQFLPTFIQGESVKITIIYEEIANE
ncbi:MAG: hypothetical protein FWE36_00255 [Erysipelotrichales bacterium]|nr:hypothetical protein [Erysipelotrichales bacterium]